MSDNEEFRVRNIGIVCSEEGTTVWVDHIRETRPRGHGHRDKGTVGLMLEVGDEQLAVFLGPEDGLLLDDRIRRAVDLVLEISEDEPEAQADRAYPLPGRPRLAGGQSG